MSSTDISDSSTSDTSMATPLSSPPSTSSSSLSPAVTPHAVHHNRLLSCAVQTYDFVRSVTIVFPGVLLAVVAYWLKTETLCQGVQRPDFCHRVVWLTFPLALTASLLDVGILVFSRLAVRSGVYLPVSVCLSCHLAVAVGSTVCLTVLACFLAHIDSSSAFTLRLIVILLALMVYVPTRPVCLPESRRLSARDERIG
ncbi:hypothetical protein NOR_07552 [Metarhizium rileyi]|uniref:Uncharacterized protein n=1 Tax=Metarhizium rileyi (strain RCEF 4871) TaxID=1649241 RepID=A0A166Y315_METRR|nr:hypothetical protein NOR_07552 [Metarhizium rileyi RCEF 4871]